MLASSFSHRSVPGFVVQGGGFIGTGNNVMIGGIILTGQKTIIVRALGPTLTQFGVANALNDPALELRNSQGTLVDSNDNWQSSPKSAQIQASGLAPPDSAEPAVLATLPNGKLHCHCPGSWGNVYRARPT